MPFDRDALENLETTLDDLSDPTPEETYDALLPYEPPMVASAAARRALAGGGGGGGGSTPSLADVLAEGNDGDAAGLQNTGDIVTGGGMIDTGDGVVHVNKGNFGAQWGDINGADGANSGGDLAMPDVDKPSLVTWDEGFNNEVFAFFGHTIPGDAAIDNGCYGFWYDQTNGSNKLMFKAKSADGTVSSGPVGGGSMPGIGDYVAIEQDDVQSIPNNNASALALTSGAVSGLIGSSGTTITVGEEDFSTITVSLDGIYAISGVIDFHTSDPTGKRYIVLAPAGLNSNAFINSSAGDPDKNAECNVACSLTTFLSAGATIQVKAGVTDAAGNVDVDFAQVVVARVA